MCEVCACITICEIKLSVWHCKLPKMYVCDYVLKNCGEQCWWADKGREPKHATISVATRHPTIVQVRPDVKQEGLKDQFTHTNIGELGPHSITVISPAQRSTNYYLSTLDTHFFSSSVVEF